VVKGTALLIVLFGSLLIYRALGAVGVAALSAWIDYASYALATMFLLTSVSHFAPLRRDLVAMVPPGWPRPDRACSYAAVASDPDADLVHRVGMNDPCRLSFPVCEHTNCSTTLRA
jgi:hypothetical protein